MKKLVIDVTQKCIDNGVRGARDRCPIALAAGNAGLNGVEVMDHIYYPTGENRYGRIDLPAEALYFIMAFDKSWLVFPFAFEVEVSE